MAMRQTLLTCSGHMQPVVDLPHYGYFLIGACKDDKPMPHQGDTGDWIGTFLRHKDATKAAIAAADFRAKVWDAVSGDESMTLDSHYLLTVGQDKLYASEPKEMSGHTPHIKKALWCSEDKQILSADDKTSTSMEYIPEGEISVVTYVQSIVFHSAVSLDPLKPFEAPANINSASLHPEKKFLVAGDEVFKLYKYDHNSGEELESYKEHFSPIHYVRFSPDGELCACGSEDRTLRLWQTLVGKPYGLEMSAKPKIGFPETTEEELEETASENSDCIYSSTPDVKA
uniref:Serine-threonine kinase receptor-associated protein n=1 Tax=Cebus imitator TaxID=2715852 RepID=A0A2K5QWK4_CEBIM